MKRRHPRLFLTRRLWATCWTIQRSPRRATIQRSPRKNLATVSIQLLKKLQILQIRWSPETQVSLLVWMVGCCLPAQVAMLKRRDQALHRQSGERDAMRITVKWQLLYALRHLPQVTKKT